MSYVTSNYLSERFEIRNSGKTLLEWRKLVLTLDSHASRVSCHIQRIFARSTNVWLACGWIQRVRSNVLLQDVVVVEATSRRYGRYI